MLRTSLGVTLFVYWMLYLVFVRDFEVHSRTSQSGRSGTVFVRCSRRVACPRLLETADRRERYGRAAPLVPGVREPAGAAGPGDPRGAAGGPARRRPGRRRVALAGGNGAGRRPDRGDRDHPGRHPAARTRHATRRATAQLAEDSSASIPTGEHPNANTWNILIIVTVVVLVFAPRSVRGPEGGDVALSSRRFRSASCWASSRRSPRF